MSKGRVETDDREVRAFLRMLRKGGNPGVDAYLGSSIGKRGKSKKRVRIATDSAGRGKRFALVDRVLRRPKRINILIAEREAANGRDPWHLSDSQAGLLQGYAVRVCDAIIANKVTGLTRSLKQLGGFMLRCFDEHFEASQSTRGSMTPLAPGYVESKVNDGLDPRPLIKTGSFRYSVKIRIRAK